MRERTANFVWIAVGVIGSVILIGGLRLHSNRMHRTEIDRISRVDHEALLAACRSMMEQRDSFADIAAVVKADRMVVNTKGLDLAERFPKEVSALEPRRIDFYEEHLVVLLSPFRGTGVLAFKDGALRQFGSENLINGLWLSAKGPIRYEDKPASDTSGPQPSAGEYP